MTGKIARDEIEKLMEAYRKESFELSKKFSLKTDRDIMTYLAFNKDIDEMEKFLNGEPLTDKDLKVPEFSFEYRISHELTEVILNEIAKILDKGKEPDITREKIRGFLDPFYEDTKYLFPNQNHKLIDESMNDIEDFISLNFKQDNLKERCDVYLQAIFDINSSVISEKEKNSYIDTVEEFIEDVSDKKSFAIPYEDILGSGWNDDIRILTEKYNIDKLTAEGAVLALNQMSDKNTEDIYSLTEKLDSIAYRIITNVGNAPMESGADFIKPVFNTEEIVYVADDFGISINEVLKRTLSWLLSDADPSFSYLDYSSYLETKDSDFISKFLRGYDEDDLWQAQELILKSCQTYLKEHIKTTDDIDRFSSECANDNFGYVAEVFILDKYFEEIIIKDGNIDTFSKFMTDTRNHSLEEDGFGYLSITSVDNRLSDTILNHLFDKLKSDDSLNFKRDEIMNVNLLKYNDFRFYDEKNLSDKDLNLLTEKAIDYSLDDNLNYPEGFENLIDIFEKINDTARDSFKAFSKTKDFQKTKGLLIPIMKADVYKEYKDDIISFKEPDRIKVFLKEKENIWKKTLEEER